MKKIILLLLSAAFMSLAVNAQKITTDQVPASVASAFKAKFPDVTKTIWEMENGNEALEVLIALDGKILSKTIIEKELKE